MLSTVLVRNEDEVREFYDWLLCRAQEEENCGKADNGRVYRDYAESVSQEIVLKCTRSAKGKKKWLGFRLAGKPDLRHLLFWKQRQSSELRSRCL
jgi:hypothetical protein